MPLLPTRDAAGVDLPVRAVLPDVLGALAGFGTAVLVAPPGTGKTTLVPLAIADEMAVGGRGRRVVVAQPRRVAVRAAARRMAALVGCEVGGAVGYSVRGDRRVGPDTRVEVVTTGVLLRRLQRDPELAGTAVVVLDECHERQLAADLALAFLVDVRANLRPDLLLLATSATAETDRLRVVLAGGVAGRSEAPVVGTDAPLFDVEVVWCPPSRPVAPAHGLRVDPALLDHVAAVVRRALGETSGDVLVFLPGVGEIAAVAGRLGDLSGPDGGGAELLTLHGRQAAGGQDAVFRPGSRRRVVLASAVADSSVTVPGVRVVVDAGLARSPRTDYARGLGSLVTVGVSRASATQRAGRAGRQAPGRVYRCWSAAEHERRPAQPEPEVAVADLTGFALSLACWGHPSADGLELLGRPPAGAMDAANQTLRALGAVDAAGRATARGRAIGAVGVHPRLARALLDGAEAVGAQRAAEVVAVLSEDGGGGVPGPSSDDLVAVWRRLRVGSGADRAASARWREETRRLRSSVPRQRRLAAPTRPAGSAGSVADDLAAGFVVGLAFPERLARRRAAGSSSYLTAGGTAAELAPGSALTGTAWLAVAVADRAPGRASARIRLAAALDEATALEVGEALVVTADEVGWVDGALVSRQVDRLGAIVLASRPLARPDPALIAEGALEGLRAEGLGLLRWSPEAVVLRDRMAFCRRLLGEPWPDVSDAALLESARSWLGPELARVRRRADLERVDAGQALRRRLPWPQAARFDELAPERVAVPSGSRVRLDYSAVGVAAGGTAGTGTGGTGGGPTLAVRVAEVFGWQAVAPVADGRSAVVVQLLSPAGRPVAVTSDLASFWRTGYPQVRAELRARYPRHPWPEDPTTAVPTRRVAPRRRPS